MSRFFLVCPRCANHVDDYNELPYSHVGGFAECTSEEEIYEDAPCESCGREDTDVRYEVEVYS